MHVWMHCSLMSMSMPLRFHQQHHQREDLHLRGMHALFFNANVHAFASSQSTSSTRRSTCSCGSGSSSWPMPLRPHNQHHQREDLHVRLVLARLPGRRHRTRHALQIRHDLGSANPCDRVAIIGSSTPVHVDVIQPAVIIDCRTTAATPAMSLRRLLL